jgi:hypothetical protein
MVILILAFVQKYAIPAIMQGGHDADVILIVIQLVQTQKNAPEGARFDAIWRRSRLCQSNCVFSR